MATSEIDTVVIGGGQAGLATSYWLKKRGISHVVLEKGRVGHSWRSQRWDSFMLNTPNLVNLLPGDRYEGGEPTDFAACHELVRYFEQYRARNELPLCEGVQVTEVRKVEGGFEVIANAERRSCRHVVLCTGDQSHPRLPALARQLPRGVQQLHAADYRRPDQLADGAVLVVGSGQSGVQITEDLLEAGRDVYLSTSAVGRAPRRYRGKDLLEWMILIGMTEQTPADLQDPSETLGRQPHISGTRGGHSVSLHQLAREGARLLGRLSAVRGQLMEFDGDLLANAAKGDQLCAKLKGGVDMFVEKSGTPAPPAEPDPADVPFEGLREMAAVREIDLASRMIRSVVWATGFGPKFDYLDAALLDERGLPRHQEGVCELPGLYCVGLIWQRRRVSGLIAGVNSDAEYITAHIAGAG